MSLKVPSLNQQHNITWGLLEMLNLSPFPVLRNCQVIGLYLKSLGKVWFHYASIEPELVETWNCSCFYRSKSQYNAGAP